MTVLYIYTNYRLPSSPEGVSCVITWDENMQRRCGEQFCNIASHPLTSASCRKDQNVSKLLMGRFAATLEGRGWLIDYS